MKKIISVKNLYKLYRVGDSCVRALDGVSFDIREGEFCAIVGTSGSGKSTLLNMLAGLEKPTKGEIVIDGCHIEKLKEDELVRFRRENVGFVFQSFHLIGTMNAVENVALPLTFRGEPRKQRMKKAERILELVNQTFVNYIGNYDYYLEKKEELTRAYAAGSGSISGSAGQTAGAPSISTAPDTSASAAAVQPGSKLSWQEQKEQQAKERKRKNDLKKTEEEISRLEDRNAQIDHEMTLEEVYSNSVKCQELAEEHAANEKRLEELYEMWETLAE